MGENKNVNIQNEELDKETLSSVVESEDVIEVALAESESEESENTPTAVKDENNFEYTESEMSGLTAEQKRRKEIFDKITTGILIALMASPVAVILYIFLWFIFR